MIIVKTWYFRDNPLLLKETMVKSSRSISRRNPIFKKQSNWRPEKITDERKHFSAPGRMPWRTCKHWEDCHIWIMCFEIMISPFPMTKPFSSGLWALISTTWCAFSIGWIKWQFLDWGIFTGIWQHLRCAAQRTYKIIEIRRSFLGVIWGCASINKSSHQWDPLCGLSISCFGA